MKIYGKQLKAGCQLLWQQLFILLLYAGIIDLFNELIAIPILKGLTTFILQKAEIPFVNYENLLTIIASKPWVIGALILELIGILVLVYLQFAVFLWLIDDLRKGLSYKKLPRQVIASLKTWTWSAVPLFTLYFIAVFPAASAFFQTPLLAKVRIPQFLIDFMVKKPLFCSILIISYLAISYLAVRFALTLPLTILKGEPIKAAMRTSWQQTSGMTWLKILGKLLVLLFISSLALLIAISVIVLLQGIIDQCQAPYPFISANFLLLFLQGCSLIASLFTSIVALLILLELVDSQPLNKQKQNLSPLGRMVFSAMAALVLLATITGNLVYLSQLDTKMPLIVSHRGVSDQNGVQNTLPALIKTCKLHPDYVEMDIHETKDGKFVVMHDENLKQLANVNKRPRDLTLRQLTSLTVSENGHRAKIPSFDEYLKTANKLHQKLLVEYKATRYDSPDAVKAFEQKYGANLLRHHHLVQSLNYRVVSDLKMLNPKLSVYYIQPYNFTYPQSLANGFSMEYSTMINDYSFVASAHQAGQKVFTWDMNDEDSIRQMLYLDVDGLITDNVKLAQSTAKDFVRTNSYANKILNYASILPLNE